MPTMVERVTQFLQQALRFDAIDGARTQAAFATLDGEIDTNLTALQQAAATGSTTAFRAAERADGGVFEALGNGASGLGFDFQRDAVVLYFGDLVLGGPQSIETATETAFLALDEQFFGAGLDLQSFGGDLAGLGSARTPGGFTTLETSLVGDAKTLSTDFATLATDVGALVASLPSSSTTVNAAGVSGGTTTTPNPFAALLQPLATEFSDLSSDFSTLAGLFGGGGGSGGPTIESAVKPASTTSSGGGTTTAPGPFDTVFGALETHFLALDGTLQGLAGPLANLLLPAVSQT